MFEIKNVKFTHLIKLLILSTQDTTTEIITHFQAMLEICYLIRGMAFTMLFFYRNKIDVNKSKCKIFFGNFF